MPSLSELFPTQNLSAGDLNGKEVTVTIESVSVEKIGDDVRGILSFRGAQKRLVLNKTNAYAIGEHYGEGEANDWVGKQITLYPTTTMYQGKRVACIRVRVTPPAAAFDPDPEVTKRAVEQFIGEPEPDGECPI
jgi:hypothetical protein